MTIGLLNTNYNFGGEFVEGLVKTTKVCLKSCRWSNARFMLWFMADLVDFVDAAFEGVLQVQPEIFLHVEVFLIIKRFLSQVRRDWLAYSVLSVLPCSAAWRFTSSAGRIYTTQRCACSGWTTRILSRSTSTVCSSKSKGSCQTCELRSISLGQKAKSLLV